MRQILFLTLLAALLFVWGCNNDDSGTNPFGPGGNGNVTFTMQGQGTQTSYEFYFQPSVNVKLSRILASLPAQSYTDTVPNNNPNYIFSKDTAYTWYPYTGVNTGQQWTFTFTGTIASDNAAFTVSSNFNVP
jgi:hypothetical protein